MRSADALTAFGVYLRSRQLTGGSLDASSATGAHPATAYAAAPPASASGTSVGSV